MLYIDIKKKLSSFTLSIKAEAEGAVAFIGPSGCGKSVTLKCIAGIMKPDSGHIEYNGKVLFDSEHHINLPPQKRHIGYLFQSYALFPDMTVKENILAGARWKKDKAERLKTLDNITEMLHIGHLLDSKPYSLSGGEAQRTALARMIVNEPEMMLFDEPFSALDVYLKDEIKAQFKEIIDRLGKDYIIVTHSMDEAYSLSSSMFVIDKGCVIRHGRTDDVFSDPVSIRSARIMGYRNISDAYMNHSGTIEIPAWNISIENEKKAVIAAAMRTDGAETAEEGIEGITRKSISSPSGTLTEILLSGARETIWIGTESSLAENSKVRIKIKDGGIKPLTAP